MSGGCGLVSWTFGRLGSLGLCCAAGLESSCALYGWLALSKGADERTTGNIRTGCIRISSILCVYHGRIPPASENPRLFLPALPTTICIHSPRLRIRPFDLRHRCRSCAQWEMSPDMTSSQLYTLSTTCLPPRHVSLLVLVSPCLHSCINPSTSTSQTLCARYACAIS